MKKMIKLSNKTYKGMLLLLTAMALVISGCADEKKKKNSSNGEVTPPVINIPDGAFVPGGSGPGEGPGDEWEYGGTSDLNLISTAVMSEYTTRPINSPQNLRININMVKTDNLESGEPAFEGTITIGYTDNGVYHEGYFTSGSGLENVQQNIWYYDDELEKIVFHGVFEDFLGGLAIVIDDADVTNLGDGFQEIGAASGSVWFKNFESQPNQFIHPPTYCWFVSLGPYDCRPWPEGHGMDTQSSANPRAGYKKLAKFSGLDLEAAFNGEL